MSGTSLLHDGHTSIEEYGCDLDQLGEGDRVGVMRSSQGKLHFYINGVDQGEATGQIPSPIWAVVDLYGKCAQVSIYDAKARQNGKFANKLLLNLLFSEYFICY